MKGSDFVFNYVDSLYYQSHEINLNPSGSYTDSHDWMKKIRGLINLTNKKYNKCSKYTVTVALYHK